MDLSPHLARTIAFRIVRKGYDPAEVDAFRERAATAIETAQNQATAMEARARAAVSKLQEATQAAAERKADASGPAPVAAPAPQDQRAATPDTQPATSGPDASGPVASVSDAETISRTLLLAQRTAETTVNDAKATAEAMLADARRDADSAVADARSEAARLIDEARADARRRAESERAEAINEVQALLARRDFLISDVEHLEQHIAGQRDRVRRAADSLLDLAEHPSAGLGDVRRPLLSASAGDGPGGSSAGPSVVSDGTMAVESTAVDAHTPESDHDATDDPIEPTPVQSELVIEFDDRDA